MLVLEYVGVGGTVFDYPVYKSQNGRMYFDTSWDDTRKCMDLYTGAYFNSYGELVGEPNNLVTDRYVMKECENEWVLDNLFIEFPSELGRVSFIQMYCKAHGKDIALETCYEVDEYLDSAREAHDGYSLAEWFKDTCIMYPETFIN